MEPVESATPPLTMKNFDGLCLGCGYQLRGLPVWRCPECGRAFDPNDATTFVATGLPQSPRGWCSALLCSALVLVLVIGFVVPGSTIEDCFLPYRDARLGIAQSTVTTGGPLDLAIALYRTHVRKYPRRLADLVNPPSHPSEAAKWIGPYIRDPNSFLDPWGAPLRYCMPGTHNPRTYDLWSVGPDGQSGTSDDIGNW